MQEIINTSLMTFGAGFSAAALSKAQGPGRALDDIMTLVGFERLHEVAEIRRYKRELNVKYFKESIAQKIANIPEERIQEPQLSTVGLALEASKYYIEEDSLREMFAILIASSMDSEKQDFVHPSFVEVIKQLTSTDANFIKEMADKPLPIGSIFLVTKEEHLYEELEEETNEDRNMPFKKLKKLRVPDFEKMKARDFVESYYVSPNFPDFNKNQLTISSLERLGLIKVSRKKFDNESLYDFIHQEYNELISSDYGTNIATESDLEFELRKGIIETTPYGFAFLRACTST